MLKSIFGVLTAVVRAETVMAKAFLSASSLVLESAVPLAVDVTVMLVEARRELRDSELHEAIQELLMVGDSEPTPEWVEKLGALQVVDNLKVAWKDLGKEFYSLGKKGKKRHLDVASQVD